MARDWEAALRAWGKPPSDCEDDKRDRTETEIKEAIRSSAKLKDAPLKIYAKGSYANRTNVRLDYDVDIAVEYAGFYYYDKVGAAADVKKAAVESAITPYTGAYGGASGRLDFKADVERALVDYYGRSAVTRGNMAMRIRERQTTLPADVVPCHEYHYVYDADISGRPVYHQGTRIYPDQGSHIHNWAVHQYEKGVAKNDRTGRRYKRMVRALKRLENELVEAALTNELPSFFMECLVYNVPDEDFNHDTYLADMRHVLAEIFNETRELDRCKKWLEANERKSLFHSSQSWTFQQAHALARAAWDHVGFQ